MSVDQEKAWNPKIIVFACNWCTYAAADLAGSNHLHYPADVRIIRTPCSGRMDPLLFCGLNRGGRCTLYPDDTGNATMVVAITITGAVIRL